MVEEVEEVHLELDVQLLKCLPVFADREVCVVVIGTATEAARLHVAGDGAQLIANQSKGPGIDDGVAVASGDTALPGDERTERAGEAGFDQRAVLVELAGGAGGQVAYVLMRSLEDGEVVSVLGRDDAGHLPAAKDPTLYPVCTLEFGQEVGDVGDEHIGTVYV